MQPLRHADQWHWVRDITERLKEKQGRYGFIRPELKLSTDNGDMILLHFDRQRMCIIHLREDSAEFEGPQGSIPVPYNNEADFKDQIIKAVDCAVT